VTGDAPTGRPSPSKRSSVLAAARSATRRAPTRRAIAARVTLTAHAWQSSEVATAISPVPAVRPNACTIRNRPGLSSRTLAAPTVLFNLSERIILG
jgi:hypothetical protein